MNVDVAERALGHIMTAGQCEMGSWVCGIADGENVGELRDVGYCGTAACIAGWVALDTLPREATLWSETARLPGCDILTPDIPYEQWAIQQLGISDKQAATLFYVCDPCAAPMLKYLIDHPDATRNDLDVFHCSLPVHVNACTA